MYTFAAPTAPVTHQQPQHHFTPKTPSPLRTSRNANLMPPPPQSSSTSPLDTKSSPIAACSSAAQQNFSISQTPQPRRASTPSIFPSPSSSSRSNPASNAWPTFASRSRASTPQATLSAQNATAKDRRKSLFRDKIRKQRDDARFERRGDQVLRMDFVRERREWEERLARRAPAEMDADESMEGVDDGSMGEEDGIVSLTEEEEIETLAQDLLDREDEELRLREERDGQVGWEAQRQRQLLGDRPDSRFDGAGSYGSDEEDYDLLFMAVLSDSQEQGGLGPGSVQQQQQQQQQQWNHDGRHAGWQDQPSSSMDLS